MMQTLFHLPSAAAVCTASRRRVKTRATARTLAPCATNIQFQRSLNV